MIYRLLKYFITLLLINLFHFAILANDTSFVVKQIIIKGNTKTKANIILRELTFQKYDTINNWQFHSEKSRQQLLNLSLFNEVTMQHYAGDTVHIIVKERWYFWPKPNIHYADRNFNQWLLSKDLKRLIYGLELDYYNIGGRNHTLKLDLAAGYTQLARLRYNIPTFNKKMTWGIKFDFNASRNREIWLKTVNDKVTFFHQNNEFIIKRASAEIAFIHRKKQYHYHQFYTGYRGVNIADTILSDSLNKHYLINDKNTQNEGYIGYQYTFDKRDSKGYPLQGIYIKASAELQFFGQKKQAVETKLSFNKYWKLHPKWYGAFSTQAKYYTLKNLPYNLTTALGYHKEFIRGYELYVIDGNSYTLSKAEIKFLLLNKTVPLYKRIKNYEVIPISIFLTAYSDWGYVNNNSIYITQGINIMPNSWQYGNGIGINLVAYYNYCIRLEYTLNKQLIHRPFVHFVAAF